MAVLTWLFTALFIVCVTSVVVTVAALVVANVKWGGPGRQ